MNVYKYESYREYLKVQRKTRTRPKRTAIIGVN